MPLGDYKNKYGSLTQDGNNMTSPLSSAVSGYTYSPSKGGNDYGPPSPFGNSGAGYQQPSAETIASTPKSSSSPGFADWWSKMAPDRKKSLGTGLLSAGLNLMASAGRTSPTPISSIGLLGEAGLHGLGAYQQQEQLNKSDKRDALQNALLGYQVAQQPLHQQILQGQAANVPIEQAQRLLQNELTRGQVENIPLSKQLLQEQIAGIPTKRYLEQQKMITEQAKAIAAAHPENKVKSLLEYRQGLAPDQQKIFDNVTSKGGTNVSVGATEKEESKAIGKGLGEYYNQVQSEAKSALAQIDNNENFKNILAQTETGKLEPIKTKLASYAEAIGVPVDSGWKANQTLEAISNKLTVMARKVGDGQILAGQISDSDREFLKASVPSLDKSKEANLVLIDINTKLAKRQIEVAQLAQQYYEERGTMLGFNKELIIWTNKNPLFPSVDTTVKKLSPGAEAYYRSIQGGQ